MFTTLRYTHHEAHLDREAGVGLLVLPAPSTDFHEADDDLAAVGRDLAARGFTLVEPDPLADVAVWSAFGLLVGVRADGREVVGLTARRGAGLPVVRGLRACAGLAA